MISDKNEFKIDAGISNIVGALTDPIIVFPGGWGNSLPDWMFPQIRLERLIENIRSFKGETPTGTDAEAAAYLMTLSLTRPISEQWTRIYLYVAGQAMKRYGKIEMPDDIKVESLSDYDMRHLNDLKTWIYKRRVEVRKERERATRREAKNMKKEVNQQDIFVAAENKQQNFF